MGIFDPKSLSTQEHLDIEDIRDNLVVLKNGKVSVVIGTSAINFELLALDEQDARIGAFAAFLNSIRFPIQIVIKTQRTDIERYQKLLATYKQRAQTEEIANQVAIYQEFINNLTSTTQVLDKNFYVVVPSVRLNVVNTGWLKQLLGREKKIVNISQIVRKAKEELYPKRDHVIKQFANLGIQAKQLQNDELIKLYYSVYEPDKRGIDYLNLEEDQIGEGVVSVGQGDV